MPSPGLSKFGSRSQARNISVNINGIVFQYLGLHTVGRTRGNGWPAIQIPSSHQVDHTHWGHCTSGGQSRSKAPITADYPQVVRIIHPNHPLSGQCVRVIRPIRAPQTAVSPPLPTHTPRWVITHPQIGVVSIPQAWAVPAADPPPASPQTTAWPVNGRILLHLVILVHSLQSHPPKENAYAHPTPSHPAPLPLAEPVAGPTAAGHLPAGSSAQPTPGRPDRGQPDKKGDRP